MRTFLYAFALCSLLVLTAGCALTGDDGSTMGRNMQGSDNGKVENSLFGAIVAGQTNWFWGQQTVRGCSVKVNNLIEVAPNPSGEFTIDGVWTANLGLNPYISSTVDTSGDGYTSGIAPGWSGVAFGGFAPCTGAPFADSVRFKDAWPGGSAVISCMTTENLLFTGPASGHANNFNAGALDRLSLEERIMVLNSIDLENDLVDIDGKSMVKVNLTEVTLNGDTFRPENVGLLMSDTFDLALFDSDAPGVRPFYSWYADQLQVSLDAGTTPEMSIVVNDNFTLNSVDALNWLAANNGSFYGITQEYVDGLRDFAGSDITGTNPTDRAGRR